MYSIRGRNVNEILPQVVQSIVAQGVTNTSRNGPVIMFDEPFVTIYDEPRERVLFDPIRDANIFFHLFETLWMLAGRDDLKFVKFFNKRMAEYSDDGQLIRGSAYGVRWRRWFGQDQIENAVNTFRSSPDSRRVVLSQWDGNTDPWLNSKDIPCNTHCYVTLRHDRSSLDLTVCNRSNDLVYGCYGSNVFHFSALLEYLAGRIGVKVGTYTQFSNNLHAYSENEVWQKLSEARNRPIIDPYAKDEVRPLPFNTMIVSGVGFELFDRDLKHFFEIYDVFGPAEAKMPHFQSAYFQHIVRPMWNAYLKVKNKDYQAAKQIIQMEMPPQNDIRSAAYQWVERREAQAKEKNNAIQKS